MKRNNWIPVTESLPEPGERIIISTDSFVCEAYMGDPGQWYRYGTMSKGILGDEVKAWQPMPERYEG